MYAYSRIKKVSKSLDLTNLPPHTPTSLANYYNPKPKENKPSHNIARTNPTKLDPTRTLEQDHDEVREVFGVILDQKYPGYSDSSTLSNEKQSSSFQNVVKRSFSIGRSASVTKGYRRMNHCYCHELVAANEDNHCNSAEHKFSEETWEEERQVCLRIVEAAYLDCKFLFTS